MNKIKQWLGDSKGAVNSFMQSLSELQVNPIQKAKQEPTAGIGGEIEIQVHDKYGKLITDFKRPMHTFVDNAAACLMCALTMACDAAAGFSVVNVSGVAKNVAFADQNVAGDYCVVAPINNDDYGVLVGTSSVAWAWAQYALQGKIAHGVAAGQLSHGVTTRSYVANGGAPAKCTIQRSFDNNSGADISVREIGWFMLSEVAAASEYWMAARDVITTTTVPNGGRLTVTYNILINPT